MMVLDDRSEEHRPDLRTNPFVLLGITPATPSSDLGPAYERARRLGLATEDALRAAVEAISDPSKRLPFELGYPLESTPTQVETILRALLPSATEFEQLKLAEDLGPLSRLGLLSCAAIFRPAGALLLAAILDAQAAISVPDLYSLLKSARSTAGLPAPSLVAVNQALQDLTAACHESIVDAYSEASQAADPLLICCQNLTATHDPYRLEALTQLVSTYERATAEICDNLCAKLRACFDALEQEPTVPTLLDQLDQSLRSFLAVTAPLIFHTYASGRTDREFEAIAETTRQLLSDLASSSSHKLAVRVAKRCVEIFDLIPGIAEQFAQTAGLLEQLAIDTALKNLKEAIERREADGLQLGRGVIDSTLCASDLWFAFAEADEAAKESQKNEIPWLLMRDFALRLAAKKASLGSAQALIISLFGTAKASGSAIVIQALGEAHDEIQQRLLVQQRARRRVRLGVPMLLSLCTAAVAYLILLRGSTTDLSLSTSQLSQVEQAAHAGGVEGERTEEAIPPVGTGQHFSRQFVRYCEFQKQRLRIIKQYLESREDIAAFNTLANDYNSRCSNYFYRDEDMKIVTQELTARQQGLQVETKRILASWPWRTVAGAAPQTAK